MILTLPASPKYEHPVRVLLFARRISHRQIADATGYTVQYVERAVNGRTPITPELARRFSQALAVPAEELFSDTRR